MAFERDETHGIVAGARSRVLESSAGRGWTSLYASEQHEDPFEGEFAPVADQLLVLHLDGPVALDTARGGTRERTTVPAGGVLLHPGGAALGVRLHDALHSLHVYVRRSVIERVAGEAAVGDPADIEISPRIVDSEPSLAALLRAVRDSLYDPDETGVALHVDYLSQAIAYHLLRQHSNARLRPPRRPSSVHQIALRKAIDHMREHLDQRITLGDLARLVGVSESLLYRIFAAETGLAPHRYLMALRLNRARDLLAARGLRMAEIAFECGFANQEHMARCFRRQFGLTPSQFRQHGPRH